MALEIQSIHFVVQGTPLVQPSDKKYGGYDFVSYTFTLFQNSFEVVFSRMLSKSRFLLIGSNIKKAHALDGWL